MNENPFGFPPIRLKITVGLMKKSNLVVTVGFAFLSWFGRSVGLLRMFKVQLTNTKFMRIGV